MAKINFIYKETFNDDKDASITKSIKVCSSIENAKKIVLEELKEEWGDMDDCHTLKDVAFELTDGNINSYCDDNTFMWDDNGKGNVYRFVEIDTDYEEYQVID